MTTNRRILIIDDNRAIHEDFKKILAPAPHVKSELQALENELFEDSCTGTAAPDEIFELTSAYQGQEGVALVEAAEAAGRPFALAFVDVRMPPGWDGVETIARLWEVSPRVQAVICTAYSDYSWQEITEKLGCEQLVMLRKPFDPVEVHRIACNLAEKWSQTASS
jgi:CheY-like chemotaxis protein